MYDGYLSNAEDEVEGATPVIIKTVKGNCFETNMHTHTCLQYTHTFSHTHTHTDNTPDIVVKSLIEGGSVLRHVPHRLLLQLLACHASDTEQPMLLFPKTMHGTLKSLLLKTREPKRGSLVSVCVLHVFHICTWGVHVHGGYLYMGGGGTCT